MRKPQQQRKPLNDMSRCLTPLDPNHTFIAVIELSKKTWLAAGIIPGVERQPLKKLEPDENELLKLLERWRTEAERAGHKINRIAVAFESGRDGFWLARWLRARGIEADRLFLSANHILRPGTIRRDHDGLQPPNQKAQRLIRVIDIETTGIDPASDAIIEIASVDIRMSRTLRLLPKSSIASGALTVHRRRCRMEKRAPSSFTSAAVERLKKSPVFNRFLL